MAKIILTLEDNPGGGVKAVFTPDIGTMMKGLVNGHEITEAEGYAVFLANALKEQSKYNGLQGIEKRSNNLNLVIPKVGL